MKQATTGFMQNLIMALEKYQTLGNLQLMLLYMSAAMALKKAQNLAMALILAEQPAYRWVTQEERWDAQTIVNMTRAGA